MIRTEIYDKLLTKIRVDDVADVLDPDIVNVKTVDVFIRREADTDDVGGEATTILKLVRYLLPDTSICVLASLLLAPNEVKYELFVKLAPELYDKKELGQFSHFKLTALYINRSK